MPTKQQLLIGVLAFALLVIVVVLIVKQPKSGTTIVEVVSAPPNNTNQLPQHQVFVLNPSEAKDAPPKQEQQEPPQKQETAAENAENVEAHRAELLRGNPLSRARVSAPTTSALIMNAAREHQTSKQNIGETAVMDRLMPSPSTDPSPW